MKKVFSVPSDYDFKIESTNDEVNKNKEASEWFAQITDMVKAELKNSTLIETEAFLNNEKAIKLLTINKIKKQCIK